MAVLNINREDIIAPDGILVVDTAKRIIAFNDAAQRITGLPEDEVIFRDYQCIFPHAGADANYIANALIRGESYSNLTLNITHANGRHINVLVSITPIKPPDKEIAGAVLIFRNTEEMSYLVKSLREKTLQILDEKNKLEAIFNSRREGTFTIDKEWKITSFNTAAAKITGYTREEAIGQQCWEIFQSNVCKNGCHMECTMDEKNSVMNNEVVIVRKDGQRVPIRVNSAPLFNAVGKQVGGVETFQDITEIKNLATHLEERYHFENIIGRSKSMQKMYVLLENLAHTDSTVLITGESGTGKELAARAIHLHSERRTGPFVVVNCSAFVESLLESELFGHEKGAFTGAVRTKPGRFELAHKGTLFLDEIGDISPTVQVKLLRVLETLQFERVGGTKPIHIDVRILAATNKDLLDEVHAGRFRDDLYYRLNVINLDLPPLRARMDDLPLLLEHFLGKFRLKFKKNINGISPTVFRLLKSYDWPGNIREFENVIEHAFVLCQGHIIESEHLPERLWYNLDKTDFSEEAEIKAAPLERAEKALIQNTLGKYSGHRGKTAEALGIDKSTLWRKMKKYELI